MNPTSKRVVLSSIGLYVVIFIIDISKVFDFDFSDIRELLVWVYLIFSFEHHRKSMKEKNSTIAELKKKISIFQRKN
jgi:hypothetical protein